MKYKYSAFVFLSICYSCRFYRYCHSWDCFLSAASEDAGIGLIIGIVVGVVAAIVIIVIIVVVIVKRRKNTDRKESKK